MEFEKLQMIIAEVLGKDSEQIYAKARLVEEEAVIWEWILWKFFRSLWEWKTRLMLF